MTLRILCGGLLALALLVCPAHAQRTPLYQDGVVVPNHLGKFTTQGRSSDVGGLDGDALGRGVAPFAIDDAKGAGIRMRDGKTSGPYHELDIGHDADGNAVISAESVNGAPQTDLYCQINGVKRLCFGGIVFNDTQTEGVTAAGQDQGGATALADTYREHVVLSGTGGVALPACGATPKIHEVLNVSGGPVRVYPVAAGTDKIQLVGGIQLAANTPIEVNTHATLVCRAAGAWVAAFGPRVVGSGPVQVQNAGAALQASLSEPALTAMLQRLGYQPQDTSFAAPFFWQPLDVSGDSLTFPPTSCGGGATSCTVCTVEGLLTHLSMDIVWPTNSGTHAPNIGGVPSSCWPSKTWVAHRAVGSIDCPGSTVNELNLIPWTNSASLGNPPDTANGRGTIELRAVGTAITNATFSGKQCVLNFTFPRSE